MADTNRDGVSALYHDSALTNSDLNAGLTTNERSPQKRTRSQRNVPNSILRLPLSRSPLKDARKARVQPRGTSTTNQGNSRPYKPGTIQSPTMKGGDAVAASGPGAVIGADMQKTEGEEETELYEGRARAYEEDGSNSSQSRLQDTRWPTITKKRASPDTGPMRAFSSPGGERKSKRTKVDAFRALGRKREHSEYCEPLRDPEARTPCRNGYTRASSAKPTPSPSKASSILPRAQSVPLGGEKEVPAIDLTSVPPSPHRSPNKTAVEIRRAPSVSPPDDDRMDVDAEDTSALLPSTNAPHTHITSPQANPVFRYTVNFATPRKCATPSRTGLSSTSPLSPLTPLPPSPFADNTPEMQNLLLAKASAKLLAFKRHANADTDTPTGSVTVLPVADSTGSASLLSRPTTHVPKQPSPTASASHPTSIAASSPCKSRLAPPTLTSNMSTELVPPPTVGKVSTVARGHLSPAASSRQDSNLSRPSIIGSMKPKRGPSAPQNTKRVTRSVSMKEQRTRREWVESEDTTVNSYHEKVPVATAATADPASSDAADMPPPSTTNTSKLRPPKSTGATSSKSKPTQIAHRSASLSIPPPDPNKLKQASLTTFMKPAVAGGSTASSSTSNESSSKVLPPRSSSSSKLPVPSSPLKRPSATQTGNLKPSLFSLGSTSTGAGKGTTGRSLSTLSHALDKLVVPPPSRPNTSMGFVREDGVSDEESTPENGKGKGKARDDTSLPCGQASRMTFTRPTASSLKRAATATSLGSTAATRLRGRGGVVGGIGGGRGTTGIFGRAGDRASKKTSLPVVAGSPVKGSGASDTDRDGWGVGKPVSSAGAAREGESAVVEDGDVFASRDVEMQDASTEPPRGGDASQKTFRAAAVDPSRLEIDLSTSPTSAAKGKQRARAASLSTLNPASSALHALSESLSSLPHTPTPPKPKVVGTRTGLRSSTNAASKESPLLDGSGSVGLAANSEVHCSGGAGPSGTVSGSGGIKKSTLKILKRCAIFVDVRTEQGDDAGGLFVDMLKGLGARIMGRLGQTCTHIVYKNGLPNTLTRYRMLNDPKPVVVGIAWVVECAEKRAKVDEEKFKIDVDLINVAGGNKRRRSMLPKYLIPVSPGPDEEMPLHTSSEADDVEGGDLDGSPSQDLDISIRSKEEDDLPPLERARRRRSIFPGGQTRLKFA